MTKNPYLHDADWLRERYEVDRMSTIQIAQAAGVPNDNATTVRRALIRHGVSLRSISEARSKDFAPPVTYTEKACTNCGAVKPLDGFHVSEEMRDGRKSWCKRCTGALSSQSTARMRVRVVEELGAHCAGYGRECGETDLRVLTVDHVNGGGGQDRKGRNPYTYYKSMLTHLEDFQALCHNCNHLKRLDLGEHRQPA